MRKSRGKAPVALREPRGNATGLHGERASVPAPPSSYFKFCLREIADPRQNSQLVIEINTLLEIIETRVAEPQANRKRDTH
jgi:hypothetical protein